MATTYRIQQSEAEAPQISFFSNHFIPPFFEDLFVCVVVFCVFIITFLYICERFIPHRVRPRTFDTCEWCHRTNLDCEYRAHSGADDMHWICEACVDAPIDEYRDNLYRNTEPYPAESMDELASLLGPAGPFNERMNERHLPWFLRSTRARTLSSETDTSGYSTPSGDGMPPLARRSLNLAALGSDTGAAVLSGEAPSWQTCLFLFCVVYLEEAVKRAFPVSTWFLVAAEFLSVAAIATSSGTHVWGMLGVRVMLTRLHFVWAALPFWPGLGLHLLTNIVAVTYPNAMFTMKRSPLHVPDVVPVTFLVASIFPTIVFQCFSVAWFLGRVYAITRGDFSFAEWALIVPVVWVAANFHLDVLRNSAMIFVQSSVYVEAYPFNFALFCILTTLATLWVYHPIALRILMPVSTKPPPGPFVALTRRRARALRNWERSRRREWRQHARRIARGDKWANSMGFGEQNPLFVAENVVLLVRDFMNLRSWGDYVSLAMRVHYLMRPGVPVTATLVEELAYLRAVAGFTLGEDPFFPTPPTTPTPPESFKNCGVPSTANLLHQAAMEGKERVSGAAAAVLAWHEGLMRTSFGRSMAVLLQGLLASVVLSQTRTAVKGVAWAHLLLGQADTPPPSSLNMAHLIEWGVRALQQLREVRDMILPAIYSGDPSRIFDPGDKLTQATCRVRQAIASQAEYLDVNGVHFDPQGWVDELEACEALVMELIRDKGLKPWDQSALRKLASDLTIALVDARKNAVHLQCRKQPFFIMAVGPPGVGKTDNIEMVGFSCLMRNNDAIPSKHTHIESGTVKYHDGYNGNEPIVRVEDPTLSIQQEFDPLQFVSMLKSRYPYSPNMAAVELKNSRFAAPKILILTTNEDNPATNRQKPEAAFARRIDLYAEFTVNPEFEDKHGIGLDGRKIAANPTGDYYRVKIAKWVIDANMRESKNPSIHLEYETGAFDDEGHAKYSSDRKQARMYTPLEFNDRAATMYVEHSRLEGVAVALKNARQDQWCSKCRVSWAVHGAKPCPFGGQQQAYDNPARKLDPGRWANAWGGATLGSWREWASLKAEGAKTTARAVRAFAMNSEARGAAWRFVRGRADVWDAAAVAGIFAEPAKARVIARLLALRKEVWFQVLVGGVALSAAAMAISRLTPLFSSTTVAPTATCNVYVNGGKADWASAGPVVSRVPWVKPEAWPEPPRSKRVSGTTLERVQADVDDRMVRILYKGHGHTFQVIGMRIGGTMVLTHRHAYEFMLRKGLDMVCFDVPDAVGAHTAWVPRPHEVFTPPAGDYVVFRCDALNPLPFFKYFHERGSRGPVLGVTRLLLELSEGKPRSQWQPWTEPAMVDDIGTVPDCDMGIATTQGWELAADARMGDCGSPLVAHDGTFLGILTAKSTTRDRMTLYQGFDASDFKAAHAALRGAAPIFDVKEGVDVYDVPGGEAVAGDLAARSTLRRIPPEAAINADVAGTLEGFHGARNKSGMQPTPFIGYVNLAFPRVAGRWAVPSGAVCQVGEARFDPFDRMLNDFVGRGGQWYNPELVDRVRDTWVRGVVQRIPAIAGSLRASLAASINGDELMKRVDVSTSSGFLGGGPKIDHLNEARDEQGVQYTLKPDAQAVWDRLGQCFADGVAPHMLVRVFLKLNEVRPVEKIAQGGTRTINCVPFPLNLRVKSVFGRLSAYLQRYKTVTGVMIGLNCGGVELDEVLASMCDAPEFTREMADEKWWADWDTKHQDLSLDRRLLSDAWRALIEIAQGLGADAELVREMHFWSYVLMMPRAVLKGGDMLDVAYNSSGHQYTTEVNSVAALIGYYYACARIVGVAAAFIHLFVIVYGDDVLMRVSKWLRDMMQPRDWVEGLAEYGLTITPGSKRSDDGGEYRALGDCTFLKRRVSRVAVGAGRFVWTAALDEDSILKGLAWYEPSDRASVSTAVRCSVDAPLPRVQQLCEIVRNAQFEWWAYGREVFEERTAWLRSVGDSTGIGRGVEWRTYDGITEDYYAGRYTTMTL